MHDSPIPARALIVGASSSIGLALCERYLEAGALVTAHFAHRPEALSPLLRRFPQMETVQCDLTDLDAVAALAQASTETDALVLLASRATSSRLSALDTELLLETVKVGALSNFVLMGTVGPMMARRQWGRIVVGSSIGVKFGGGVDSFAYALAHHASEFIPREARDWAAHGVLTNVVRIGVTDTPIHGAFTDRDLAHRAGLIPMHRPASPSEIADFLFWHGSSANTYVTGQVTAISGGE